MSTALQIIAQTVNAPNLLWDTTWTGTVGDWAPAPAPEPSNLGGLRALYPLQTAILLCLMSDARAKPGDFIPDGSGDPRGWPGDAIDFGIAPLGSRLWQLRRRELTPQIEQLAEIFAAEALQTLIDQKAVAAFDISAAAQPAVGQLRLVIKAYQNDGTLSASLNFSLMWAAAQNVRFPLSPWQGAEAVLDPWMAS